MTRMVTMMMPVVVRDEHYHSIIMRQKNHLDLELNLTYDFYYIRKDLDGLGGPNICGLSRYTFVFWSLLSLNDVCLWRIG